MDPKGKVALVTGGASGIGLACVTELLDSGTKVAISDKNVEAGNKILIELKKKFAGDKVIFIETDVTSQSSFEAAIKKTIDTFKSLDIIVNNAGIANFELWELEIAINLTGVVRGTMLGFKYMGKDKGAKGGTVVNMSSVAGLMGVAGEPVYAATKHGVIGLTRSFGLPYHFDKTAVRVMAVCPGVTETPLVAGIMSTNTDMAEKLAEELNVLPSQTTENVAKGVLHIIRHGSNGSIWVSEGGIPVYQVQFPEREVKAAK